jgi:hypothetical protein
VVIGPLVDVAEATPDEASPGINPGMTYFVDNIIGLAISLNNDMKFRTDRRPLKIFIADYPPSSKLNKTDREKAQYDANLNFASQYLISRYSALKSPSDKVEISVINVWQHPDFTPRSEIGARLFQVADKNGEKLWQFANQAPGSHPNFATVCAASNRLTTTLYESLGFKKPAYPAADDICQR